MTVDRSSLRTGWRAGRALTAAGLLTTLTLGPLLAGPSMAHAAVKHSGTGRNTHASATKTPIAKKAPSKVKAATATATKAACATATATATATPTPPGTATTNTAIPLGIGTTATATPAKGTCTTVGATPTATTSITNGVVLAKIPTPPPLPKGYKGIVHRTNGYQIGAYYFSGWSHAQNNNLTPILTQGPLSRYQPLIGWYDDSQAQVDKNIDQAAAAGIDFFSFDFYDTTLSHYATDQTLNEGLNYYMHSTQRWRLGFALTFIDQAPFLPTPKDWPGLVKIWIQYFKQPDYVRVNGKPLFIVFSPEHMRDIFGNSKNVHRALDYLRAQAKKAHLPGVTIAVGATVAPNANPAHLAELRGEGYDVTTGYNYHAMGPEKYRKPAPYSYLVRENEQMWDRVIKTYSQPYIPVITSGWDQRFSAREQKTAIIYKDRTPAQFACYAAAARQWVDKNAKRTSKEKVVMVYAWNEIGEGGWIIPTKADRYGYTNALKSVFTARKAPVCK